MSETGSVMLLSRTASQPWPRAASSLVSEVSTPTVALGSAQVVEQLISAAPP